jgi:hypothetical protein
MSQVALQIERPQPSPVSARCDRQVKAFALKLTANFRDEISSDPRRFKKHVIEVLRRSLPPFSGRPTDESVTTAANMRANQEKWLAVYRAVIPNHSQMDPAARSYAESNLRSAVRSRRNARARRKRPKGSIAETSVC